MSDRKKQLLGFSWAFLGLLCSAHANAAGQVVNYALQTEPPQLNSTRATDTQSFFILGHILEGLTRYGKTDETLPGVAEKWEITDKGATFHLRKNAKWSDGKPVTAEDFIFAWKLVVDPKNASEYAFIMYPVKNAEAINQGKMPTSALGVVAPDEHTLKITFEKPCGYFLGLTAFGVYMPVRKDIYEKTLDHYAADAKDMAFNGPFMLTQWVHGASIRMDKNPNYWNKENIALDEINIPYITADNNAKFNFFEDNKVDILERLNKDDLYKAQTERYKMKNFSDGSVWYLEYNFRKGRTTVNKNLRKAMQLVFNSDEYVSKVIGIPGTKPGRTLIPSWLRGKKDLFRKEYPVAAVHTDFAQAKKYIEKAKAELKVTEIPSLVLLVDDTPQAAKEAEYLQNLFKNSLGLNFKIDKQIFKQRLAKMLSGDFDIVAAGWGPDFADPMTFAELKTSWNENNRGKYSNPEYDRLIRVAQSTANSKIRMDAMAAAEKIMLDDLAILPTYERTVVYLTHDRVQGVVRHAIGPDPDFNYAKIVSR